MTAQQSRTIKTAVLVALTLGLLGMAWESKADTTDVEAIAAEVRDIKYLICRQYPDDSKCQRAAR